MGQPHPCNGRLGLRIHSFTFIPSIALLFAINLWTGSHLWAAWVLLGWGVGLLAHWWFIAGPGATKVREA